MKTNYWFLLLGVRTGNASQLSMLKVTLKKTPVIINWKPTVSLDMNWRQQPHAPPPIPPQLTEVGEVLWPCHCCLLTGVWASQEEDLAAIPDGSLRAPCLWDLLSLPDSFFKSWQILSLSPSDKLITFFSVTFKNCRGTFLSFPVHTSVLCYQEISQVSLSCFSPPTHFVSNNTNMNAKIFKNNQDIFQISCSCLFNTTCFIWTQRMRHCTCCNKSFLSTFSHLWEMITALTTLHLSLNKPAVNYVQGFLDYWKQLRQHWQSTKEFLDVIIF